MIYKAFEFLFLLATFLSFTATTYSPPWTSSSMEFFAFLAILFLFLSIPSKEQRVIISRSSMIMVFFLIFSLGVLIVKRLQLVEQIFLVFLYGLFYILCSSCVFHKNEKIKEYLCITILSAILFNGFVMLSQYFHLYNGDFGIWVADYDSSHGRPYGNFGQPNLAATFLLTGLCSCIWLYKKKIGFSALILVSVFVGCVLALPSSKTSFLCIAILISLAIMLRDKKSLIAFTATALALFITKHLLPNTRDVTGVDISTGRFDLWITIFNAIFKSPWLGYGVLNTRVAHFSSRELDITPRSQVIGSAHNLFLDFLVWFGVIIGLFFIVYFVYIVFVFFKRNINSPEKIYLIIPILLHSQLEYPLFYANFLLLFAFVFNMSDVPYKVVGARKFAYSLFFAGFLILAVVFFEYIKLSSGYTQLRFFNKNFVGVEKPKEMNFIVLDTTGGQFNFFLKEKISTQEDYEDLKVLTKAMPSFKNYSLLIAYMAENEVDVEEVNFWMRKAKASFDEKEVEVLERILKYKNIDNLMN